MSTILEALKKSEKERKLNNLPTLSDMPPPQERSNLPVYLLVVICVLLLTLLVFLGVQWWLAQRAGTEPVAMSRPVSSIEKDQSVTDGADVVVNVVSYSSDSSQSFVMIDGKMVREKEFVRAGLQVEKIEQNAVILNQRGKRIKRTP